MVEPQIPQNTGNIARTCSATGAWLHLVGPLGFEITNSRLKRAGLDYWDTLAIFHYDSFEEYQNKQNNPSLLLFSTKAQKLYTEFDLTGQPHLVFGREDKGLPQEMRQAYPCARLPMLPSARSLNLSNAVAVAVYEQIRQQGKM